MKILLQNLIIILSIIFYYVLDVSVSFEGFFAKKNMFILERR